eukprot:5350573-Pyramimonas_sp.AAC.1
MYAMSGALQCAVHESSDPFTKLVLHPELFPKAETGQIPSVVIAVSRREHVSVFLLLSPTRVSAPVG